MIVQHDFNILSRHQIRSRKLNFITNIKSRRGAANLIFTTYTRGLPFKLKLLIVNQDFFISSHKIVGFAQSELSANY